jgi:hypothetical protein
LLVIGSLVMGSLGHFGHWVILVIGSFWSLGGFGHWVVLAIGWFEGSDYF